MLTGGGLTLRAVLYIVFSILVYATDWSPNAKFGLVAFAHIVAGMRDLRRTRGVALAPVTCVRGARPCVVSLVIGLVCGTRVVMFLQLPPEDRDNLDKLMNWGSSNSYHTSASRSRGATVSTGAVTGVTTRSVVSVGSGDLQSDADGRRRTPPVARFAEPNDEVRPARPRMGGVALLTGRPCLAYAQRNGVDGGDDAKDAPPDAGEKPTDCDLLEPDPSALSQIAVFGAESPKGDDGLAASTL